jgi:hypothetical protein
MSIRGSDVSVDKMYTSDSNLDWGLLISTLMHGRPSGLHASLHWYIKLNQHRQFLLKCLCQDRKRAAMLDISVFPLLLQLFNWVSLNRNDHAEMNTGGHNLV